MISGISRILLKQQNSSINPLKHFIKLQSARNFNFAALSSPSSNFIKSFYRQSSVSSNSQNLNSTINQTFSKNNYDSSNKNKRFVGYWYLFNGALVFGIVVIGGLTRLTESGLSITEWNVIRGMKPPISQEEWISEFEKYQQFPEYKLLNRNMTLAEFKFIFYMEWAHRMWGRFIGLSFIIPGAYFAYKGYMSPALKYRSAIIATMIGFQGLLGWLMVKSGLNHDILHTPNATPRVSHYWLTAHLGSAFLIYSSMLVTGLEILRSSKPIDFLSNLNNALSNPQMKTFKKLSISTTCLIFVTALSGALVAGLDAGLIYNEFPYMGLGFVPSDMWAFSTQTEANPNPISWWRNMLENPSAVQFDHRVLAMSTTIAVASLWIYSRKLKIPKQSRLAINALLGVVGLQVSLGISTLLYLVPVPLAAAHQSGSLTLLSIALWLVHTLRKIPKFK